MTTRGLLNILLFAAAIGLVLVAVFQPGIKPPPPPVKLTALAPEQVKSIRIERAGKTPLTLQKTGSHWRITAPRDLPADDGRMDALLRLLQDTSQVHFAAKPAALGQYKLDKPALTVTFNDLAIAFGDTDPINGRRYLKIGDAVHLVTDLYYYQFDADLPSFVSTRLLPEGSRLTALTLPDFTLQRDAQGHWSLTPERKDLPADAIQTLLDAWRDARALWVKAYEPGKPLGSVTLQLDAPQQELHFDILAKQPELVLARPDLGLQYHLAAENAEGLLELRAAPPAENPQEQK